MFIMVSWGFGDRLNTPDVSGHWEGSGLHARDESCFSTLATVGVTFVGFIGG